MARWSTRSIRNRNSSLPQPHSGGGRPLCGAGFEGGSSNTASPHSCNCWVSSSDTGPGGQSFLQDPPSSWVAEYGGSLRNQWAQRILTACHWCIFRFHNSYEFSVLTAHWISRVFTMHMPGWVSPSPLEADSGVTSLDLSWFCFVCKALLAMWSRARLGSTGAASSVYLVGRRTWGEKREGGPGGPTPSTALLPGRRFSDLPRAPTKGRETWSYYKDLLLHLKCLFR